MRKIKDKSKKIKVSRLQITKNIFILSVDFTAYFSNILFLLSLAFYLLSFF